ncbi:LLM class flavin-dependent oxidoreductase [Williamsia sterculiae]|uniref:Flavin-dependent oxidoreductase, luciferase family (Includes alkanesulfonate monooxygenase SsuD and methylene tetrahydromethanopterin reductase) n=1 Tax=Williamsia sterculiae TaxID=1344003 RepID=A0A1N7FV01_9NOCA|nr:LLM class flavin-dependent oxidoreductase [Williamsia sterculiae]SIS04117.1 Flavin-dependent oxidoreductase, luciferase family (includes alkanesulfonate monooxygenase SsuD and methylene tetrahydromethanopterin reductase) [Williamsia sterculiae]
MPSSRQIHLGVALDGAGWHPAAWRDPHSRPRELFAAEYWADLAATAEHGLLDFATIEDTLASPGPPGAASEPAPTDRVRARLDANLVAARIAPTTTRLGLIPTITTTHTEPFHVSKALATLDYTSRGRAGWQVRVSPSTQEAGHFGRRQIPELDFRDPASLLAAPVPEFVTDLFAEAADFVEVVRRLWDSWEDDAEIRDVATRRFIDRGKLHHVDFQGRFFSVRGPSITPRPPQGQPVVTALAHRDFAYELAARTADLVFVTPGRETAAELLTEVGTAAERVGRAGEPLRVFADVVVFLDTDEQRGEARLRRLDDLAGHALTSDAVVFAGSAAELADLLAVWSEQGVDGIRLRPGVAVDDLTAISSKLVPELQRRGLFRTAYTASSLRGLLRLPVDVPNRYAATTSNGVQPAR